MSNQFVGEIRLFAFPRIPIDWVACDGSLLQISEYETLYTLLGTTYGGDGVITFGVPDLRGRAPVHQGRGASLSQYVLGQQEGTESVTLTGTQLGKHSHAFLATTAASDSNAPSGTALNGSGGVPIYFTGLTGATPVVFSNTSVSIAPLGGPVPHDNMMPSLTMSYCISTVGIFPTQQ